MLAQVIATPVDEVQNPGNRVARRDASRVSSGVYFYKLEALSTTDVKRSFTQVEKMVLMK